MTDILNILDFAMKLCAAICAVAHTYILIKISERDIATILYHGFLAIIFELIFILLYLR